MRPFYIVKCDKFCCELWGGWGVTFIRCYDEWRAFKRIAAIRKSVKFGMLQTKAIWIRKAYTTAAKRKQIRNFAGRREFDFDSGAKQKYMWWNKQEDSGVSNARIEVWGHQEPIQGSQYSRRNLVFRDKRPADPGPHVSILFAICETGL